MVTKLNQLLLVGNFEEMISIYNTITKYIEFGNFSISIRNFQLHTFHNQIINIFYKHVFTNIKKFLSYYITIIIILLSLTVKINVSR